MNSDTGEIINKEHVKELFTQVDQWFPVDKKPNPDCPACQGIGNIGYFPNSKIIPCNCVFNTQAAWGAALVHQRELPKASKDKFRKKK